jgi:hypothetical protein
MPLKREIIEDQSVVAGFDREGIVEGTFINFVRRQDEERGSTQVWTVVTSDMAIRLATVKWFGRWRKYSLFTEANMVFENTCLGEIAEFCDELMKRWREGKSKTRKELL